MIFYFSGTGNTRWVAQQLAEATHEPMVSIAEALRTTAACQYTLQAGECIGFAFPVYSWGPPQLVLDFVARLVLDGYTDNYLYFVCTCGDDVGKTRQIFQKAVAAKGWTLHCAFSLQMPNTYVCLPGFDVDSEAVRTHKLHRAVASMHAIAESILQKKTNTFRVVEGRFAWLKSHIIRPGFSRMINNGADKQFTVSDTCIGCGKCAAACPMQNVEMKDNRPVWKGHCTNCLACYHTCPVHAINYGTKTAKKGQYLHDNYVKE